MIVYIKGDFVELAKKGVYDAILHGTDCFAKMNNEVSQQVAENFPQALNIDKKTIIGDKRKLGSYSKARVLFKDNSFDIINCYVKYEDIIDDMAYQRVMKTIARDFYGKKIAIPLMGFEALETHEMHLETLLSLTEKIFKYNEVDIIVPDDKSSIKKMNTLKNKLCHMLRILT